jgi:hypothetical protein
VRVTSSPCWSLSARPGASGEEKGGDAFWGGVGVGEGLRAGVGLGEGCWGQGCVRWGQGGGLRKHGDAVLPRSAACALPGQSRAALDSMVCEQKGVAGCV